LKRLPISLFLLLTLAIVTFSAANMSVSFATRTTVWSADFETGTNSQFNGYLQNTCTSGIINATEHMAHNGKYAGYYYGGPVAPSCKETPTELFDHTTVPQMTSFHWEMWVMVVAPSLQDWISLATFSSGVGSTFTLDGHISKSGQYLALWLNNQAFQGTAQTSPVVFPLNKWFKLSLDAYNTNTPSSQITIYQDNSQIIQYDGELFNATQYMNFIHFGLYMGQRQPAMAVLNDNTAIDSIGPSTTSAGTVTRTSTSANITTSVCSTLSQMATSVFSTSSTRASTTISSSTSTSSSALTSPTITTATTTQAST